MRQCGGQKSIVTKELRQDLHPLTHSYIGHYKMTYVGADFVVVLILVLTSVCEAELRIGVNVVGTTMKPGTILRRRLE